MNEDYGSIRGDVYFDPDSVKSKLTASGLVNEQLNAVLRSGDYITSVDFSTADISVVDHTTVCTPTWSKNTYDLTTTINSGDYYWTYDRELQNNAIQFDKEERTIIIVKHIKYANTPKIENKLHKCVFLTKDLRLVSHNKLRKYKID